MVQAASVFHGEKEREGPVESRYNRLKQARQPFLDRAEECASLTIPTLIPPDNMSEGENLPALYQSVGANGVTNLSAKLLMTMLPPNEPCFRLRVNNLVMEKEEETVDKEFRTKVEKALSRIEQAVLADIEDTGDRSVVSEGNQHLIVGGNVLYHDDPVNGLRLFPLSRYVVDRDPMGQVTEIIVEEDVDLDTLPEKTAVLIKEACDIPDGDRKNTAWPYRDDTKTVTIFTQIRRTLRNWKIRQECRGITIPGSEGTYRLDACPWFPVRMYSVSGEAYGRSFVELQKGDLASLESLCQSLVEGSAACAKVVGLVNPNGVVSARALTEAANGDFIEGSMEDVGFLQVQKATDFQVVASEIDRLERRLKTAFLMLDGGIRNKERVTAEEVRLIAQELETGLGGVYTLISQEFQLPYIASRMETMTRQKRIPKLPKGIVRPSIVTGYEALGRGNDKQKLMEFLQMGAQTFGEAFLSLLNPHNAITRLAASMGISTEGLVKSEEELMQEQQQATQQAQQQMLMEKLGPEAMRQFGGAIQQQMTQSQPSSSLG